MTATVSQGTTVNLNVTGSGFTQTPLVQWWMLAPNPTAGRNCGFVTIQDASFTTCPAGYVVYSSTLQFPSSATYYAPATTGVYHVQVTATQFGGYSDNVSKTATAAMTVTP